MSAQHTPGPWFIEGNVIKAPDPDDDGGAWNVAEVVGYCGYPKEQSDANAHLIAAAPDMLAALEALLDGCEWQEAHVFSDGTAIPAGWSRKRLPTDEALTAGRAAIAKVKAGSA